MVTYNLFGNMVELATALTTSSGDDHQHHSAADDNDKRNHSASTTSDHRQFEERFYAATNDFHRRMLEAVEQLDQAIDQEIKQTYQLLRETGWTPARGYQFDVGRKSNVEAASYCNLGDSALQKEYERCEADAQAAYTSSLCFAVAGSEKEAIAFAKRAELSYRTAKYESCLLDANRALKNDRCPDNWKLWLRVHRAGCLMKIEEANERKRDLVDQCLTDGDSFTELFLPSIYSGFFTSYYPEENRTEPRHVDLKQTIPTQAVSISYEPGMGRIVVANRDIEPGEIISKEEFFSMVLKPKRALSNCAYCLVRCDALISCPTCVYELYCSEECRENAFRSYHEFECKIYPYYLHELTADEADDGDFILAVRSFLIGTKQGTELRNLMRDARFRDLFPAQIISYEASAFDGHYATISNEEAKVELLTATDILKSTKLIRVLRKLSFFDDDEDETGFVALPGEDEYAENLTEMEIFAIKLIVKHLTSMKSNSFVVTERIVPTPFALEQRCNRIGDGTLGLHSLINHSCDPNAADFTRRRTNFLYTLRPIKAGEQIFISYGYCYFDGKSSDRFRQHSLYVFRCSCSACANNWPTVADLRKLPTRYLTENADVISEMENKSRIMWTGSNSRSKDVILRPWKIICDYCKNLHANEAKPSLSIVRCENFIEGCMRHLSNFYVDSFGVESKTIVSHSSSVEKATDENNRKDVQPAKDE